MKRVHTLKELQIWRSLKIPLANAIILMVCCCLPGTTWLNTLISVQTFLFLFSFCSWDWIYWVYSSLHDSGQKAEAAKYLRLVVAYNPGYKKFLEQCEQHEDIASDLAQTRRDL